MNDFINPLDAKADAEILAELAKATGISKDHISEIERTGTTSLATLIEISKKFALLQRRLAAYEPTDRQAEPAEAASVQSPQGEDIVPKTKKGRKKRKLNRKGVD